MSYQPLIDAGRIIDRPCDRIAKTNGLETRAAVSALLFAELLRSTNDISHAIDCMIKVYLFARLETEVETYFQFKKSNGRFQRIKATNRGLTLIFMLTDETL